MQKIIKCTERGWAGHFVCSHLCRFRRNTLLEYGDKKIVVSTVGLMDGDNKNRFERIGVDRYFETMCFYADPEDTRYHDIDVSRQIFFDSPWEIGETNADDKANEMHETVVAEMAGKLAKGKV